jgi:hypothetical protein
LIQPHSRKTFGTDDLQFAEGILNQLMNVASKGQDVDERGMAFVQSVVVGIEPRDQLETMLAAQMAAVHNATMTFARRLAHVENIQRRTAPQEPLTSSHEHSQPRWMH